MNPKRLLSVTALALSCAFVGEVKGDLFLTGDLVGIFRTDGGANVDVNNFSDGSASFRTGIVAGNSFQSGVTFTGQSFTDVGEGDTVSLGSLTYYNGVTQIGTSSHSAVLDLYLRLADESQPLLHLSTLNFAIDATLNAQGNAVPDNFLAAYTSSGTILYGGETLEFGITGLPTRTAVSENSKVNVGGLMLTVGPTIPVSDEGSGVLLFGLGLALIAIQRRSFRKEFPTAIT